MRLLYGDSTLFPLDYNFLNTLEVFMTAATRIVQLELDAREVEKQNEALAEARVRGLDALEQFHNVVMRAVQDTAQKVQNAEALEYAQQIAGFASRYVEDHKRATLQSNEQEIAKSRALNEQGIQEQRARLEGLLKVARLPVLATKIVGSLEGEGKDVRYTMGAVYDHPNEIQTSFTIESASSSEWSSPRKVSDFASAVALMVGVEKSWLRGTVSPKQVQVDDWIVTEFDLAADVFEVTLKRKLAEKDALTFRILRSESGLSGIVESSGNPALESVNGALSASDLEALEQLWTGIDASARRVLDRREQLLFVTLDGQPVFENRRMVPFVERLVEMFAPTVREIAKRSPSEFELSLKMETDGKRREEVYLRKEQLIRELQPLSASGREIFAPLGLDSWVPRTTAAPPPVTPDLAQNEGS